MILRWNQDIPAMAERIIFTTLPDGGVVTDDGNLSERFDLLSNLVASLNYIKEINGNTPEGL